MTAIEFKSLVDNHFTTKMLKNNWRGTHQSFRKLDVKHVIKLFGVHKNFNKDSFMCSLGLDFDLSNNFPKNIPRTVSSSNCLFVNTITASGVTDRAYDWILHDNDDDNVLLMETLWRVLSSHGALFYKNFENFPEPFDKIQPKEFENNKEVKLLDTYYTFDQVGFMRLLKNVNLFLGINEVAKQFSEIAISKVHTSFLKRGLTDNKKYEKQYKTLLKSLKI